MKNLFKTKNKKGYTLLFSVLTAVLVLGVAIFILGVSRKQYILASTARDSMYALYAADSGIECVAANSGAISTSPNQTNISTCENHLPASYIRPFRPTFDFYSNLHGGAIYTDSLGIQRPQAKETSFNFGFGDGCAAITTTIYVNDASEEVTVVDSRGYNVCKSDYTPDTTSSRTVERALQMTSH